MSAARQDRVIRWVLIVSAALAALTLLVAAISLPVLLDASGGIKAQRRSDEIAACRPVLNAQVLVAKSELDAITSEGIEAVALGDDARLLELAPLSAERRLILSAAAEDYAQGTVLAEKDPDAFLAACRARNR